jgi:hypothetical protein
MTSDLPYQLVATAITLLSVILVLRRRTPPLHTLLAGLALGLFAGFVLSHEAFHWMRLTSWLLFLFLPIALLTFAAFWRHERLSRWSASLGAMLLLFVGVDAFLIEPHQLEITRYSLSVPELSHGLRLVFVADLQTDDVGGYENEVFRQINALQPDVVLFGGDYLQIYGPDRPKQEAKLKQLLLQLSPAQGAWAVPGDAEPPGTRYLFRDTPVHYLVDTQTVRISGDLELVGLSRDDSFDTHLDLPPSSAPLRIVLGHAPDFSLASSDGNSLDLFVSGHTHGGQVQIPFLGPLITLSQVPRDWAAGGLFELSEKRKLIVSRGIGMERGSSPRLRFLCRPELVVIDARPVGVTKEQGLQRRTAER